MTTHTCSSQISDSPPQVVATYPGPTTSFWWRTRKPVWENYIQTGGSRLIALRHRTNQVLRFAALAALVFFVRKVGVKAIKRELIFFLLVGTGLNHHHDGC